MTLPFDAMDDSGMPELERELDDLGRHERRSFNPAFEDQVFVASRRRLRRGSAHSTGKRWAMLWSRPSLAMAAMLILVVGAVMVASLIGPSRAPEAALADSFEDDLNTWLAASESTTAALEYVSLRQELDAIEQQLQSPWPVNNFVLDEETM